jgi:hypothetical protein
LTAVPNHVPNADSAKIASRKNPRDENILCYYAARFGFNFSQHKMATAHHNNTGAFRSKLRAPANSSISRQGKRLF